MSARKGRERGGVRAQGKLLVRWRLRHGYVIMECHPSPLPYTTDKEQITALPTIKWRQFYKDVNSRRKGPWNHLTIRPPQSIL